MNRVLITYSHLALVTFIFQFAGALTKVRTMYVSPPPCKSCDAFEKMSRISRGRLERS